MESEKLLLHRIKEGDNKALQQLYERYIGHAMAVGLRYVPNRADAEDVVQDSFIKILTTVTKFEYRGEGSLKAWVMRVVTNEAINFLRKQGRFTFVDDIPEEDGEEEPPQLSKIPPQVLNRLIGELPTGYRLVLNLYVFEQKSHKEIADMLGIKESSSASQYLRAKRTLAHKIKNYIKEQE